MVVSVGRVVELVDNVVLIDRAAVAVFLPIVRRVVVSSSARVAGEELGGRPLGRAVGLARAALHLGHRGGSCLVPHATVAAESRLILLLLHLHLLNGRHV